MMERTKIRQHSDTAVRLSAEIALPSLIRKTMQDMGDRLLHRHRHRFGSAELHVHIKRIGSGVGCMAHLRTDDGSYHAHTESWDVRRGIERVVELLDMQVLKVFDRRATMADA
jgi:ribosome-associated translation inhibitor RaiA